MKDYKIKEALTNLKQSFDAWKEKTDELAVKFEIMVEILQEERDAKENEEEKEGQEGVLT